jgi:hypothetical protein
MSVEAITWALRTPVPASSAKFVLVVLANQASNSQQKGDDWLAFPSIAYIAEATSQDRKTVINNLGKLSEWGLIEDSGKRVGATKQVIVYRLLRANDLFEKQSQKRNSTETGTVPKTDTKSTVLPLEQYQKRDTEPVINRQESEDQKKGKRANALNLPDWMDPEAWAMWHRYRNGSKGWNPDAKRLSLRKLDKLRKEGHDPIVVIEQSIENGWTGLFAIHGDIRRSGQKPKSTSAAASFHDKTYTGTAFDDLPLDLRPARDA